MAFPYIPKPVYPKHIDTDYNLYKVANTAEASLSEDLNAWETTIAVKPVS